MDSRLAPRLLALPPTVRAALAGVPGPGWLASRHIDGDLIVGPWPGLPTGFDDRADEEDAWWPASPAAAVAAVLDCTLAAAHESLMAWLDNHEDIEHPNAPGLDLDAALSIIEAHVARSQS